MKVLNICFSDGRGGAGIAALRFHKMLLEGGIDSTLAVVNKHTEDMKVIRLPNRTLRRSLARLVKITINLLCRKPKTTVASYNLVPMGLSKWVDQFGADVVQLHWIGENTISVFELGALQTPTVWTLHDMWAFSGSKHYPSDPVAYLKSEEKFENQPESREVLERIMRWIKKRAWSNWAPAIIGPSTWISGAAKSSELLTGLKCQSILNPLDIEIFEPRRSELMRSKYGLEPAKFTLLFSSFEGLADPRKGARYLHEALKLLELYLGPDELQCAILGANNTYRAKIGIFDAFHYKTIDDQRILAEMYSTASVLVAPSLLDNLPNVVAEASACGVPTVAFNLGGFSDMIEHKETGFLAEVGRTDQLVEGILWAKAQSEPELKALVRGRSFGRHDPEQIFPQIITFYKEILQHGTLAKN